MDEVWWGNKIRLEEILKANMEHHGTSKMFVWKGGHVCADHAALVSLVFHFRWQCYNYSMSSLRVVYWLKSQLFHWTWGVVSFQWIACVCVRATNFWFHSCWWWRKSRTNWICESESSWKEWFTVGLFWEKWWSAPMHDTYFTTLLFQRCTRLRFLDMSCMLYEYDWLCNMYLNVALNYNLQMQLFGP